MSETPIYDETVTAQGFDPANFPDDAEPEPVKNQPPRNVIRKGKR